MAEHVAESEFPFRGTAATEMLKQGLLKAASERGLSTRAAARELGYKATVVISHMATGRVPIPLDRAFEIAEVIGLDPRPFYIAVLEQRHPDSAEILSLDSDVRMATDSFAAELQMIAGCSLNELPDEHKAVMREVISERHPRRRWLSLAELSVVATLRRYRPRLAEAGLTPNELDRIGSLLA
jgi:hypothetical protein